MTQKNTTSYRFFLLLSAIAGFLMAIILYNLLEDTNKKLITDFINLNQQEEISTSPKNISKNSSQITSFASAVHRASPSVVNIFTHKQQDSTLSNILEKNIIQQDNSLGSGVIISSDGYIITNNHVISDAKDIQVLLKDGRYLKANLIGHDLEIDLALLKVSATELPTIEFGDSESLQVGDIALAIGNPFGLDHTVTFGIVSALNRSRFRTNSFDNFIQTDAAINPGNSGGALVDIQGKMIGLNTINISNSGGSQGIGFAIPSTLVREVMYQLITYGKVQRGWIGIEARQISPMIAQQLNTQSNNAILIIAVLENGPSDKAGIQAGDIITHLNKIVISSAQAAVQVVTKLRPGDMIVLDGIRNKEAVQFKITVQERPYRSTQ